MGEGQPPPLPVGVVIGDGPVRLWGLTPAERLRRALVRAGLAGVSGSAPDSGPAVLVAAQWVMDEGLVRALAGRPGVALVAEDGTTAAAHVESGAPEAALALSQGRAPDGVLLLSASDLQPAYNAALRKREAPLFERLAPERVEEIERRTFQAAYKGVTDLATKYIWPDLARTVTRWLARAGVSPNQVTLASFVLMLAAMALFLEGEFAWALIPAWLMCFLDTVDGKLARVTLTSSKLGNALDHGMDLVHPPFWWWAWVAGLQASATPLAAPEAVLAVVVVGYVVQRLQEGLFLLVFRIEIHTWRPFDARFRLVTARRNTNLLILTLSVAAGRPDLGMVAVAAWTVVSVAVHGVRSLQALAAARRSPLSSWMAA